MSTIRSYSHILSAMMLLAGLIAGAAYAAPREKAPVFVRGEGGRLVNTGTWKEVPEGAYPARRIFDFDRPARKRRSREMLKRGEGPSAVEGTIRVALIRIAFETNREPSLSSIATSGDFDLTPGGTSLVDPTPHDRAYFNTHMEGLDNYIGFQSCGRLEVEWEILPQGNGESYKLSDIADYGPGSGGSWTTPQLASLMYDAVTAADQGLASLGYPVRLSDYDAIILVHAGADLQSDIMADSPNDIPSFFAVLGDGDQIPIEGGSTIITEVSVVPETATQDGEFGSMSSVLAHEFGHVLGLPDLYDIYYGMPVVGVWDQMDSGSQIGIYMIDGDEEIYAVGILPSGMGAWSRYMLGWVDVETVSTFENAISLSASGKCPARVVRVDISSDEYYLIENRAGVLGDDIIQPVWDDETGVMTGWGRCLNCDAGPVDEYEWELVNAYDILLPTESDYPAVDGGPGLLVWHADEYFIADRWELNEVNSRWPYGVSLVEANGLVDLGNPYSRYRMGWYDDAFFEGNATVMSDSTFPAAWSNWGVPSGVRLEGVSERDTLMTFGAGVRDMIASDTFDPPVMISGYGTLVIPGTGETVIAGIYGGVQVTGQEDHILAPGTGIKVPLALAPGFDAGTDGDAVVFADDAGKIHAFETSGWDYCSGAWPYAAGAAPVSHAAVFNDQTGLFITATFADNTLRMIDRSGGETVTRVSAPEGTVFEGNIVVARDPGGDCTGIYALSRYEDSGRIRITHYVKNGAALEPSAAGWDFSAELPGCGEVTGDAAGDIVLLGGDLDPGSEGEEIVALSLCEGRILFCSGSGVRAVRELGVRLTGAPALQDMNGDSWVDLVCADVARIHVISFSGANVTGWPREVNSMFDLPTGVKLTTPVTTAVSDDEAWVAAGTDAGIFYLFDHSGELAGGHPTRIASALSQPVGLANHGSGGAIDYVDAVYNKGINAFYDFRQPSGRALHRSAPFGPIDEDSSWRVAFGDQGRSGWAAPSGGFVTEPASWTSLEEGMVIYPNPSRTGRVAVHFTAPESGSADLKIMTLDGELVYEASKALTGGEDEFVVSMSGRASGVYICRLVIRSAGVTAQTNRKFAHIR
ncbi:MAG TPA: immune inhibitor A domain-containing protein [Candidatus Krumholzibacterium sp.]|nr:immune inhibitor A domain-containing protein [Candidatus Krumholzibacterium sp.]